MTWNILYLLFILTNSVLLVSAIVCTGNSEEMIVKFQNQQNTADIATIKEMNDEIIYTGVYVSAYIEKTSVCLQFNHTYKFDLQRGSCNGVSAYTEMMDLYVIIEYKDIEVFRRSLPRLSKNAVQCTLNEDQKTFSLTKPSFFVTESTPWKYTDTPQYMNYWTRQNFDDSNWISTSSFPVYTKVTRYYRYVFDLDDPTKNFILHFHFFAQFGFILYVNEFIVHKFGFGGGSDGGYLPKNPDSLSLSVEYYQRSIIIPTSFYLANDTAKTITIALEVHLNTAQIPNNLRDRFSCYIHKDSAPRGNSIETRIEGTDELTVFGDKKYEMNLLLDTFVNQGYDKYLSGTHIYKIFFNKQYLRQYSEIVIASSAWCPSSSSASSTRVYISRMNGDSASNIGSVLFSFYCTTQSYSYSNFTISIPENSYVATGLKLEFSEAKNIKLNIREIYLKHRNTPYRESPLGYDQTDYYFNSSTISIIPTNTANVEMSPWLPSPLTFNEDNGVISGTYNKPLSQRYRICQIYNGHAVMKCSYINIHVLMCPISDGIQSVFINNYGSNNDFRNTTHTCSITKYCQLINLIPTWTDSQYNCSRIPQYPYTSTSLVFTIGIAIDPLLPVNLPVFDSVSIVQQLPEGLFFDATTCILSGTPIHYSQLSTYEIIVTLDGTQTVFTFTISVLASTCPADGDYPETPIRNTATLPCLSNYTGQKNRYCQDNGVWDEPIDQCSLRTPQINYSQTTFTFTIDMEITPIVPSMLQYVSSLSVSPNLPNGLSLDTTTGVLSGKPTAYYASTLYTITAFNENNPATIVLTIKVLSSECPADGEWPATAISTDIHKDCPEYQVGFMSRFCKPDGTWNDVVIFCNYLRPTITYPSDLLTLTLYKPMNPVSPTVTNYVNEYRIVPDISKGLFFNKKDGSISGTPRTCINTQYTITASNPTFEVQIIININVETLYCDENNGWSKTSLNSTIYSNCDGIPFSSSTRTCLEVDYKPVWDIPNFDGCKAIDISENPSEDIGFIFLSLEFSNFYAVRFNAELIHYIRSVLYDELIHSYSITISDILIESITDTMNTMSQPVAIVKIRVQCSSSSNINELKTELINYINKDYIYDLQKHSSVFNVPKVFVSEQNVSIKTHDYSQLIVITSITVLVIVVVLILVIITIVSLKKKKNQSHKIIKHDVKKNEVAL